MHQFCEFILKVTVSCAAHSNIGLKKRSRNGNNTTTGNLQRLNQWMCEHQLHYGLSQHYTHAVLSLHRKEAHENSPNNKYYLRIFAPTGPLIAVKR